MSVQKEDQSPSDQETVESTENSTRKSEILEHNEGIKSGESKFKVFTFNPTSNITHDTEKCKSFWNFIEGRKDLNPAKAFQLRPLKTPSVQNEEKEEEDTDWNEIMDLLKEHGLNKVTNDTCKICDYEKSLECICEDHFDVKELNNWDPFRKTFTDVAVITDKICVQDVTTQTDFKTSEDIELEKRLNVMNEIDDLMKKLEAESALCNCPKHQIQAEDIPSETSITKVSKTTCTCGKINCYCTEYLEVLTAIAEANHEVDALDLDEISTCGCSCLNLALIRNYRLLLECKMELEMIWERKHNKEVICVCKLGKCPCSIVLNLHKKIDSIFGWEDETQDRVYCTCKDYYENVWEKLSITTTPSYLTCKCISCEKEFVADEYFDAGLCDNCVYKSFNGTIKTENGVKVEGYCDLKAHSEDELTRCHCNKNQELEEKKMKEELLNKYEELNDVKVKSSNKHLDKIFNEPQYNNDKLLESELKITSGRDVSKVNYLPNNNITHINEDEMPRPNLCRGGQEFCKLYSKCFTQFKERYEGKSISQCDMKRNGFKQHLQFVKNSVYEDNARNTTETNKDQKDSSIVQCKYSNVESSAELNNESEASDYFSESKPSPKNEQRKSAQKHKFRKNNTCNDSNSFKCKCIHTIISHGIKEGNSICVEGKSKHLHDRVIVPRCLSVRNKSDHSKISNNSPENKHTCCFCGDSDLNDDLINGNTPPYNTPRSTKDGMDNIEVDIWDQHEGKSSEEKYLKHELMKGDQKLGTIYVEENDLRNREEFGDFKSSQVCECCHNQKEWMVKIEREQEVQPGREKDEDYYARMDKKIRHSGSKVDEDYCTKIINKIRSSEIIGEGCCAMIIKHSEREGEDYCVRNSKREDSATKGEVCCAKVDNEDSDSDKVQCRRSTEIYYCRRISAENSELTESYCGKNSSNNVIDYACCYFEKTEAIIGEKENVRSSGKCDIWKTNEKINCNCCFNTKNDSPEENRNSSFNSSSNNITSKDVIPKEHHLPFEECSYKLATENMRNCKNVATNNTCRCENMTNTHDEDSTIIKAWKYEDNASRNSVKDRDVMCKDKLIGNKNVNLCEGECVRKSEQYKGESIKNGEMDFRKSKNENYNNADKKSLVKHPGASEVFFRKENINYTIVEQELIKTTDEYLPKDNDYSTIVGKPISKSCDDYLQRNWTSLEGQKSTNDSSESYQSLKIECRNRRSTKAKPHKTENAKKVYSYSNRNVCSNTSSTSNVGRLRRAKTCYAERDTQKMPLYTNNSGSVSHNGSSNDSMKKIKRLYKEKCPCKSNNELKSSSLLKVPKRNTFAEYEENRNTTKHFSDVAFKHLNSNERKSIKRSVARDARMKPLSHPDMNNINNSSDASLNNLKNNSDSGFKNLRDTNLKACSEPAVCRKIRSKGIKSTSDLGIKNCKYSRQTNARKSGFKQSEDLNDEIIKIPFYDGEEENVHEIRTKLSRHSPVRNNVQQGSTCFCNEIDFQNPSKNISQHLECKKSNVTQANTISLTPRVSSVVKNNSKVLQNNSYIKEHGLNCKSRDNVENDLESKLSIKESVESYQDFDSKHRNSMVGCIPSDCLQNKCMSEQINGFGNYCEDQKINSKNKECTGNTNIKHAENAGNYCKEQDVNIKYINNCKDQVENKVINVNNSKDSGPFKELISNRCTNAPTPYSEICSVENGKLTSENCIRIGRLTSFKPENEITLKNNELPSSSTNKEISENDIKPKCFNSNTEQTVNNDFKKNENVSDNDSNKNENVSNNSLRVENTSISDLNTDINNAETISKSKCCNSSNDIVKEPEDISQANYFDLNCVQSQPTKSLQSSSYSTPQRVSVITEQCEGNVKKRLLVSKAKIVAERTNISPSNSQKSQTSKNSSKISSKNKNLSKSESPLKIGDQNNQLQKLFKVDAVLARKVKISEIEGCQSRLPVIAEECGKDSKLDVCTFPDSSTSSRMCKINNVMLCFEQCGVDKNKSPT